MGLFSGVKAQMSGQKALRTHIAANKCCDEEKPGEARIKYEEARGLYAQALAEGADKPSVHQGYAILLMRLGDFDGANRVMQGMRGLKGMTDEDWFELRINYSICLWRRGRLDDAIETARRAAGFKKNGLLYTTLGMYLVERACNTGDFTEAEDFCREAMDYDDEDAGTLDNLGLLYEGRARKAVAEGDAVAAGDFHAMARDCYARANAAKPHQITTIYALARICHEDGEDDRARALIRSADNLFFSDICPVSREMMDALDREIGK